MLGLLQLPKESPTTSRPSPHCNSTCRPKTLLPPILEPALRDGFLAGALQLLLTLSRQTRERLAARGVFYRGERKSHETAFRVPCVFWQRGRAGPQGIDS